VTPTCLVARAGPCDAESPATREDDHAVLMLASTPYNRHGSARFDAQKAMPIRQPLEMPGRYCFHSTRPTPWEASQCGVERRPPVQERSELQAHETTMLQCLAVEVRKGLGRSPGPCRTSSASFPGYPTQVRDGRRALCRGAAFDLRCRSCQATSSITSSLPLNEIASPASRPSLASRVQAALAGL